MNFDPHSIVMAVTGVIFLIFILSFVRTINNNADLAWGDLVSSHGMDGKRHPSWNEIGKGLGVILCFWLPAVYVYSPKMDATGLALILGVVLAYLGGVSGYAASLRAKQGGVQKTTVTEPVPDPSISKITETVMQNAPVTRRSKK